MTLFAEIKTIIRNVTDRPHMKIKLNSHLFDDLDIDYHTVFSEIIWAIENDYKIRILLEEESRVKTVQDLVELVQRKVG